MPFLLLGFSVRGGLLLGEVGLPVGGWWWGALFDALGLFPLFEGIGFLWMGLGGVLLSGRVGGFCGHEGEGDPAENGAE
jgi:hypothetical protein